jgi:L-seryl-tRNA(Ser) seleniumtransferase
LVLAALQETALAYLRRDAATQVPFWAMVATPVDALRIRAEAIVAATGLGAAEAMDALPGAGSAPGVTMPSHGVVLDGDGLATLRGHPTPVIARVRDGRTHIDLRTVFPDDDAIVIDALRSIG